MFGKSNSGLRYSILLLIFVLLLTISNLSSQEKYTPYSITASGFLSGNIYFSDFKELPRNPQCCVNYNGAFGLGYGAALGFEYELPDEFLKGKMKLRLGLSYFDLSARFKEEEFIGNVIIGNDYVRGTSEYTIDSKLNLFALEPSVIYMPFKELPLSFKAGFQLGFFTTKTFSQEETLISPNNATYENGLKVRNQANGALPNPSSIYLSAAIGARYELYKNKGFSVFPELSFNYGFTNIVQDLNWKASSLFLGIGIAYNFKESIPPPPLPAPPPPLPPPPPIAELEYSLEVINNNKKLSNNDTVFVGDNQVRLITKYTLIPKIFFTQNSDNILYSISDLENNQDKLISIIANYLNNNNTTLNIKISALDIEDKDIIERRKSKILYTLKPYNVDEKKIIFDQIISKSTKFRYPELAGENCFAEFEFSDGKKLHYFSSEENVRTNFSELEFQTKSVVKADAQPVELLSAVFLNNAKVFDTQEKNYSFKLNGKTQNFDISKTSNTIQFKGFAKDAQSNTKSSVLEFNLITKENIEATYVNLISNLNDDKKIHQFLLGFCEFDKSEFFLIDNGTLELAKNSIKSGKKIEIIPLTDSFGTPDYNLSLSKRRGLTAIRLLGVDANNVKITIPDKFLFSNETPIGRLFNRSVLIRILD